MTAAAYILIALALIVGLPIVLRLLFPGGCGWNVIECESPESDERRIS